MSSTTRSGQLLWTEDQDGNPTDYSYDPVDNSLSTTTGPADPGNGDVRPVTSDFYDETAIGSVSGSSYTPGPALLNGLQAYFFKTPNLDSATSGGRADFAETDPSSGNLAFSWGASGPTELYSGGTNTDYTVRFVGDITLGANGDPNR